jgi:malate dehydrogenase
VQKRGAAIIDARGLSSAASAANAAIDSVTAIRTGTVGDDFTSLAVVSSGEYGVPEGLQFGFPVRTADNGTWTVVEGLSHDEFATDRIRITTEELLAERADVTDLLPS